MVIKKITINFVLFLLLFAIFDLIFSNFIYKETFRYACYKYDIDFYSLQPNCVAVEKHEPTNKNFKVYTDENGHRFLGQKKASDKKKTIIFLGDSQTYGLGLEYKDTFVGKFEKNPNDYKILNFGVPSYSPTVYNYQLKIIKKKIKNVKKIILVLDISDLLQESFRWRYNTENNKPSLLIDIPKKKEKKISGWQRFRRENFKGYRLITFHIREFLRSIKNHSESKKDEIKKTHWGEFTYTDSKNLQKKYWQLLKFDKALKKMTKNLYEISTVSANMNSELYIVIFPWVETLQYGQNSFNWENYMIKTCDDIKCTKLINLFPKFRELKNTNPNWRKELYLVDDIHLNEKGHEILYRTISKAIF